MFGVIFYIAGCIGVSGAIAVLWTITRSIQSRDEMRSWRTWMGLFVFSLVAPYAYFEILTRTQGPDMKAAVTKAMDDSDTDGELVYYKVYWYAKDKAKVMAVGTADLSWGGTERPTIKVSLVRKNGKWKAESFEVVQSDKLNKDGIVFPPFF